MNLLKQLEHGLPLRVIGDPRSTQSNRKASDDPSRWHWVGRSEATKQSQIVKYLFFDPLFSIRTRWSDPWHNRIMDSQQQHREVLVRQSIIRNVQGETYARKEAAD